MALHLTRLHVHFSCGAASPSLSIPCGTINLDMPVRASSLIAALARLTNHFGDIDPTGAQPLTDFFLRLGRPNGQIESIIVSMAGTLSCGQPLLDKKILITS